jgi:hypothetical protein
MLGPCLNLLNEHFGKVLVRGDSKFSTAPILRTLVGHGAEFVIGYPINTALYCFALNLKPSCWKPFRRPHTDPIPGRSRRRKRRRHRQRKADRRGYRTVSTIREWVTAVSFTPPGSDHAVRLVILRQWVRQTQQCELMTHYDFRAFVTNLSATVSAGKVVRHADQRCNQDNAIEQAKSPYQNPFSRKRHVIKMHPSHRKASWIIDSRS